jgi:hypothetical protein
LTRPGEYLSPYPTHAEILCRGATAWNAWREKNPSTAPDLKGVALASSKDSLDGGSVNLREACLQNSVLRFAVLSTADLEAADMSGADLMHARLDQANLNAVNLSYARLDHAHLAGAILTKVNLRGTRLRFANLTTADLQAADMSDADLTHARLDQANLSTANFKNARLDYASFAGAKFSKVNLCGACLQHAKNLTESQLEESTGSASTILPPHLQGSVSWSPAINPTIEHCDLRLLPRVTPKVDGPHTISYNVRRWGVPTFLTGMALLITVVVWLHTNETPLDTLGDASDQGLRAIAPEAKTKEKATSGRITSDTTSGASTVDPGSALEQQFYPEMGAATVSRETSTPAELQAPNDAERSAKSLGPTASTPGVVKDGYEAPESTAMVFAETPPTAWPHAIVPDLPSEAAEPSTLVYAGSGQAALSFGAETPPAPPARNPARGQHVETAQTVWPSNAEIPPKPFRNPLR